MLALPIGKHPHGALIPTWSRIVYFRHPMSALFLFCTFVSYKQRYIKLSARLHQAFEHTNRACLMYEFASQLRLGTIACGAVMCFLRVVLHPSQNYCRVPSESSGAERGPLVHACFTTGVMSSFIQTTMTQVVQA